MRQSRSSTGHLICKGAFSTKMAVHWECNLIVLLGRGLGRGEKHGDESTPSQADGDCSLIHGKIRLHCRQRYIEDNL